MTAERPRRCYQLLAEAIVAEGVDVVFGVMGDGNLHLITDLVERLGVRFVAARHEAGAVAMADGYARASGRPGVCTVTHGPGLTQTGTPLTAARQARSPVVVIAGDTPPAFRLHAQNIDQHTFALASAGAIQQLRGAAHVPEDVALAFRHVRLGLGPIVLNAPVDLQLQPALPDARPTPSTERLAPPQRRLPDPERIAAVAERIARSERPVVLAGRGAVLAGARPALLALAERIGALLATTLLAKGWFDGEPFAVGLAGGFSDDRAREILRQADLVLAFGAGLNQFTVDQGRLFPHAALVQVELDPTRVGWATLVDDAILADARATAEALLAVLPPTPRTGFRSEALRSHLAAPLLPPADVVADDGLDPRLVARTVDAALPPRRNLVVGIGHYSGYPAIAVGVADPRDLVLPWHLGSVGLGLPVGIGVAVARPEQPTLVVEGDGGLLMSLPELETAARERIPLLVVVLDDRAYGAELHILAAEGLPTRLALFDTPDLARVAESLGCRAVRADTAEALRTALHAFDRTHPLVVHVPVTRQVVHHEIFRALRP
ncbi:MAG: acetolactate synthase I/II/III large subunit [Dehalococcoidia bacterium]|nr:MAG: acetolactate synthase I/II/III large subunit [Dehalococcoidia bacterium]